MLRFLGEFVSFIFFLLLIRSVISSVWRLLSGGLAIPNPAYQTTRRRSADAAAPTSGELRKDPVCGTFVATTTAWRREKGGQTAFYCSKKCFEEDLHASKRWEKNTAFRS